MSQNSLPDFILPSPEVVNRLHEKHWHGRQYGYGALIGTIEHHKHIHLPEISVIIEVNAPDSAAFIGLNILLEQQNCNFQLIIVTNGEVSPLADMLLRMGHTSIQLKQSVNSYIARNIGALFADAPILVFLSDSVQPNPDILTQYCTYFTAHAPLSVRGAVLGVADMPATLFGCFSRIAIPHAWALDIDENMAINAQSFFRLGGFDELLPVGCGSLDLSVRLYGLCPDQHRQWYLPSAIVVAKNGFNGAQRQAQRQKSWFVLNEKYARSMLGYCGFWLENMLSDEDITNAAMV